MNIFLNPIGVFAVSKNDIKNNNTIKHFKTVTIKKHLINRDLYLDAFFQKILLSISFADLDLLFINKVILLELASELFVKKL